MPPSRRLEDHIQQLCRKAVAARPEELEAIFLELKTALHEHTQRLRGLVVGTIGTAAREFPTQQRRRASEP
jgi:hypothetical protein